jgi:hypothetical protein
MEELSQGHKAEREEGRRSVENSGSLMRVVAMSRIGRWREGNWKAGRERQAQMVKGKKRAITATTRVELSYGEKSLVGVFKHFQKR